MMNVTPDPGLHRDRQHGVHAARAGGEVTLERGLARDMRQQDTEARGRNTEQNDQGDGRGQHPAYGTQRIAREDDARLPTDHHVAHLNQHHGHRQTEGQPADL